MIVCVVFASDCTEKYIGLDPRKENHPIYNQQAEFYEKHRTFFEVDKSYDFICSPLKMQIYQNTKKVLI